MTTSQDGSQSKPLHTNYIKYFEKVQIRATDLVLSVKKLKYKQRLMQSKLPTPKYRRLRGDMIEVYKILTNKYDTGIDFNYKKYHASRTRKHNLKLVIHKLQGWINLSRQ